MLEEKFKNMKALIKSKTQGNDNKKKIENLVIFLVLLIITVIAINVILGDDKKPETNKSENNAYKQLATENINSSNISESAEYNLEDELENVLSKIVGVGQVKVMITYSETSETVPLYNETNKESTTQETDTNGGTRTIQVSDSSKEIVYEEQSGKKIPITKKVILPKVEGAIVIAKGANNANTKIALIDAVMAITGLPTHKVQVFEMKGE